MKLNPHRLDLGSYPSRFDIPARLSDVDMQSHLNNVRLMEYYQEGRVAFHRSIYTEFEVKREPGARTLVAHHAVDFLKEVHYPGVITVGVGILRIGTSSYTIGAGLFQNDQCAGLAMTVMVNANQDGNVVLPPELLAALRNKLLPEAAL